MLLPLGVKFIPETDSEHDSDEEPEFEQCQIERHLPQKSSQPIVSNDMTSLAQLNLEHRQESVSSKSECVGPPVDHVESADIQHGSMALPTAFSSDQLIDPEFLVPIDETVGSDPTQCTNLSDKYNDNSSKLPSIKDNSDSLIKTVEFLEFVDDLSQEPSPLPDRGGTFSHDTVPSAKVEESAHSIDVSNDTSQSVDSSNKSIDLSNVNAPYGNGIESTDISITESQFSSTIPYCEESLSAKLGPLGESQFLSAQPCHKGKTTHEGAHIVYEEDTSDDSTKDCSSGLLLAIFLQRLPLSSLILFLT